MNGDQNGVIEAVQRADCFLDENAAVLDEAGMAGARQRLAAVRASFEAHAVNQVASHVEARGETAKQRKLRLTLREHFLRPVVAIAHARRGDVPELRAVRMPSRRCWGVSFAVATRGMAQSAARHQDVFVRSGLPPTFFGAFENAIATFETSLEVRAARRATRAGATKGLQVEEREARAMLRVLDALVRRVFFDDEPMLRQWESARSIHRRSGPKSSAHVPVSLEMIPEPKKERGSENIPEAIPVTAPVAGDSVLEAVLQATPSHPARISVLELLREEDTAA